MIVDDAHRLHPGVDNGGTDELKPRRLSSLEIVSDNAVCVGNDRPLPVRTSPPLNDQQKSAKFSPRPRISQKTRGR
jgi:hypothetical protein